MKNVLRAIFFGCVFGLFLTNAQTPTRTQTEESAAFIRDKLKASQSVNTIEGVLNPDVQNTRIRPPKPRIISLTKRDKELISVENEDKSKYSAFLRGSDTGILRLHDSENCDEEGKTIGADEPCPWNVVGKATFYSFRTEDYTSRMFSDIQLEKQTFNIVGINLLGFLTDLGDVSLDNLSLQSKGIKEMAEFQPSTNIEEIKNQFILAKNGFQIGDHIYKTAFQMKPNNSYALRLIAYDSKVYWKIGKRKINLLQYDKRKDIVVIFRVVRENQDKSVNILWKKIQSKDAPEIESTK
jgi:hypothetical protein